MIARRRFARRKTASTLLLVAALCACGDRGSDLFGVPGPPGATGGGGQASDDELPCALSEMLARRCLGCHTDPPVYGAPMPLVTKSQLLAARRGTTTAALALARMQSDMPPPPNEAASPEEVAVLADWIEAGHPSRTGGEECVPAGTGGGAPLDCEPDVTLFGAAAYSIPDASTDTQICVGIELPPEAQKRHITAIAPHIDNPAVVHHLLLFIAPEAISPDPAPCTFTPAQWKLVYTWGPGTGPRVLPPEAGFPLDAGASAHFALQIHYSNPQGISGERDRSGVSLCTTEELRPHDADVMVFGGVGFAGIVPNATSVLDCSWSIPFTLGAFYPVTIFDSWPHMHRLGRTLSTRVDGAGGTRTIVDVADFDFEHQLSYPAEVAIDVGDTVRTRCSWFNDTPFDVGYGENTADEMCFNFVSYYPRVDGAPWNAVAPAQTASCTMAVR